MKDAASNTPASAQSESSPAIKLRAAEDGNVEALVALWDACGLTRPWNDPREDIAFARGKPNSDVLVAMREDRLVASVMVGHDGHRGAVYYVAAEPGLRGHGLGRLIMEAAEAWLVERGVWKLNLLVRKTNARVVGFYEGMGYKEEDVVEMGKRLR